MTAPTLSHGTVAFVVGERFRGGGGVVGISGGGIPRLERRIVTETFDLLPHLGYSRSEENPQRS